MDPTLLPASRVLARRYSNRHQQHSWQACQFLRIHQAKEIHILCKNMCLHGHIKSLTRFGHTGIPWWGMGSDHRLWTHSISLQEMSWTWAPFHGLPPKCSIQTRNEGENERWVHTSLESQKENTKETPPRRGAKKFQHQLLWCPQ